MKQITVRMRYTSEGETTVRYDAQDVGAADDEEAVTTLLMNKSALQEPYPREIVVRID